LVGSNYGTASNSYATGKVTGTTNVGGLVGMNWVGMGTVTNSFWDTITSGQTVGIGGVAAPQTGVTGLTTTAMMTQASYPQTAGLWDFTNNWYMVNGSTRPILRMEYSTTITNAHQLQLIGMNATTLAASYTLASNIDLAASLANPSDVWGTQSATALTGITSGFVPIGIFTGTFDGLNHTISNLTINRPTTNQVGLFGNINSAGVIRNVGLVGGSVRGAGSVGGLVGYNYGSISNSYSTGNVNGSSYVGGLVGFNGGPLTNTYSSGGTVSGASTVGGLVGSNFGRVNTSYSTNAVVGGANSGGLLGWNEMGPSFITNSFWNTQTSGRTASAGSLASSGLTTAQMQQQSNFTGWDFANTWTGYNGFTNPLLRSFMSSLTVTANNATKIYDGLTPPVVSGVTYSSTPNANLLGTLRNQCRGLCSKWPVLQPAGIHHQLC
jgi:hypothetical protein